MKRVQKRVQTLHRNRVRVHIPRAARSAVASFNRLNPAQRDYLFGQMFIGLRRDVVVAYLAAALSQ